MNEFLQRNLRTKNLSPLPSQALDPAAVEIRLTQQGGARAARLMPGEAAPRGPILEIEDVLVNSGGRALNLCVQKGGAGLLLYLPPESMLSLRFRDLDTKP